MKVCFFWGLIAETSPSERSRLMRDTPTKEAEPVPEADAQAPLPLSRRQQGTFALSFSTATVVLLACAVLGYIVGPLLKTYYFADAPIRWVSILGCACRGRRRT